MKHGQSLLKRILVDREFYHGQHIQLSHDGNLQLVNDYGEPWDIVSLEELVAFVNDWTRDEGGEPEQDRAYRRQLATILRKCADTLEA